MTYHSIKRAALLLWCTSTATVGSAQGGIGVLPFADATGSGNATVGRSLAGTMQGALTGDAVTARLLSVDDPASIAQQSAEQMLAIARRQQVEFVFRGTVLEATTEEGSQRGWLPKIAGQQVDLKLRSVKARVTLRGELYRVATGEQMKDVRVSGKYTDHKFQGTVWSSLGSWDIGSYPVFLESPLGQALQDAIASMAREIDKSTRRGT